MAYPIFTKAESYESTNAYRTGLVIRRALNGRPRINVRGGGRKLDFGLTYPTMLSADLATLKAYQAANPSASFSFTSLFTGAAHTVKFAAPVESIMTAAGQHRVAVSLFEPSTTPLTGAPGAYPSLSQKYGSVFNPVSGIDVNIAPSGLGSQHNAHGADVYGPFSVRHTLTSANLTTLLTHFDVNLATTFAFTWDEDSTTHVVGYGENPISVRQISSTHAVATVNLELFAPYASLALESGDGVLLESGDDVLLEGV